MAKAQYRRWLLSLLSAVVLVSGCTPIAVVKYHEPSYTGSAATSPTQAGSELNQAEKLSSSQPLQALGEYLEAADQAAQALKAHPANDDARHAYNYAVARVVDLVEAQSLKPWERPVTVPAPNGPYLLSGVIGSRPDRNPSNFTIIPADRITIGGTYLTQRVTVEGVGAPTVAVGREEKKDFRETLASRRLYANVTAIVSFHGHKAQLLFYPAFATEKVSLDGKSFPMAADFTAATAVGLTRERPEKLGLIRMLRPEKYADTARLTRLQPYDPNRIPVIFIHGLQDTPASWAPMINALYADPEIRRRYQFWVYSYPSGYPYPYSASLLRKELDGVAKAFPDRKPIVLVGHSMGGLVSRLMITDAGDRIWRDYFGKSPSETNIQGSTRQLLEDSLIFNHRPEIARVIFICAPHRGAPMGANWIGRIGIMLIKMPLAVASVPVHVVHAAMVPDPAAEQMTRIPTSIDTLSPNNRFVKEVNELPTVPDVPFHTIEGDRGRGDAPNSSDGVVPYWSSHLKGARSELIVPSNHSAPRNPQAIAEVDRILHLHLSSKQSDTARREKAKKQTKKESYPAPSNSTSRARSYPARAVVSNTP
jgi:pimeloyl-ACP methyl ester carboxylesterase